MEYSKTWMVAESIFVIDCSVKQRVLA